MKLAFGVFPDAFDPFIPSPETDIFHLQFLENVARKAVTLDIYQALQRLYL